MPDRATLASVAARAGVSRQTVSNVLNSPHVVNESTRDRVAAAIAELGYRPLRAAQRLRSQRSRTLALALTPRSASADGVNGSIGDRFLHALTETAQRRGYRIMLFAAAGDAAEIGQYHDLLSTGDVDGFVLANTHHGDARTRWLTEHGTPFVTFGRPWGAPTDPHAWVDVDGASGTEAAVDHLVARGHRRIAFLGWPSGSGVGDDRRTGWRRAVQRHALVPAASVDAWSAAIPDNGRLASRAARELAADGASAVVCASDSLAIGALAAARETTDGLAVVGFDDTPTAAALGLTSIAQPLEAAASCAVDLVLGALEPAEAAAPAPSSEQVLLAPRLMVRGSTTTPITTH
ncbi:transcriptional regulator, LacI family [Beutenbergia cavernae DSM 12333]|uniref:Transcriptional regulator, LacI family n=1 Tax=Beutenbergia cavernae (strain ATCC BAA-8 / DSM 12333 / CCUG 43141 / JCM 11478 / NBRC 16432 / NCIMB 13614 / HKI 0122) TaxID=471853 RepID=C5C5M0_BEUC1|nr:LacI family DNA-binding transcriptional regulator [Beutenbergia cavernae]ACQ80211.1 transcriptional regulator, LacI family [Beutenbergia cavernae DSM 12333]